MNVETVDIADLTPDPRNARTHGKRNLDAIAASLREFGQRKPIVVTFDGVVIAGNGTLEAAKQLGWKQITVSRSPEEWDEATVRAYALADNQTGALAEWDEAILKDTLAELAQDGWDITDLGFDAIEEPAAEMEGDLDEVPSVPDKPTSELGDVWLLGEHRLLVGDATSLEDLKRLMDGKKADMVWTDPPYNVAVGTNGYSGVAGQILNDNMSNEAFKAFANKFYTTYLAALKDGGVIYVAHGDNERATFTQEFVNAGFKMSQVLIWVKQSSTFSRNDFNWKHEPIIYGWKEGAGHYFCGDFTRTTVIDDDADLDSLEHDQLVELVRTMSNERSTIIREDRPTRSELHPTMKPIALVEKMIEWSSKPKELVLDLFMGSGSTLIAAHKANRISYGMELDPRYADVICARWQKLTGIKPVLEETGEEFDFKP